MQEKRGIVLCLKFRRTLMVASFVILLGLTVPTFLGFAWGRYLNVRSRIDNLALVAVIFMCGLVWKAFGYNPIAVIIFVAFAVGLFAGCAARKMHFIKLEQL